MTTSTLTPTWYDLLDVEPSASPDEVRAAWRSAIADLDPGERRFDSLNRAAAVLLDPAAREEYDASIGVGEEPGSPVVEVEPEAEAANSGGLVAGLRPSSTTVASTTVASTTGGTDRRWVRVLASTRVLVVLAVLAMVAAATAGWLATRGDGSAVAAREAQQAAERAVVPVLSYDHAALEESRQAARAHMTSRYSAEYDKLFAVLRENAPTTGTTVTADVVSSGIVRTGEDRVQVLVFVDRPTTNKQSAEPVVYRDQVTLSMQRVGDDWLVDDMVTSPVPE